MNEQAIYKSFIAGSDWPLKGTPLTEWFTILEERRGSSFVKSLNLKEKIEHETQNIHPNVLLVGSGELEPLEYGLAGFTVTAYEMDEGSAQKASELTDRAGISNRVDMRNVAFAEAGEMSKLDNYNLVVLDRVLHYFSSNEAINLLSELTKNAPSGCHIKAKIFLKDSEIFSRPGNPYFSSESWAPTYDEVLGLFPEDTWTIEENSGEQMSPSPVESRKNMTNRSVSLVIKKK